MPNISICIITKNEEKIISECIKAIQKRTAEFANCIEICITDTGSTDNTVTIAKSLGCFVSNFKWVNDFSAARNYAMNQAKNDFILFVDADEILEDVNWKQLFCLLENNPNYVGRLYRRNLCPSGNGAAILCDRVERLFNRKLYHYECSIHEQLTANNGDNLAVYDIPFTVYHEGYMGTPEELKEKALRNNNLLFKEIEKNPFDPYWYYQVGNSFGLINDKKEKLSYYQKAYELSPSKDCEYTKDLIVSLGSSYTQNTNYSDAITLFNNEYNNYSYLADFLCMGAYAFLKNGDLLDAIDTYNKALNADAFQIEGMNSIIPHYNLACIYEAFEDYQNAKKHFILADSYLETNKRLNMINQKSKEELFYKKIRLFRGNGGLKTATTPVFI